MPTFSDSTYPQASSQPLVLKEQGIEEGFIEKLRSLKYAYRSDIRDRGSLEENFHVKFEALNRVRLTDSEFQRLLDELITPDVFTAAPADGDSDVKQLQEDLLQEKQDNEQEPEKKKAALKAIIAGYNTRFGTNHAIASSISTIRTSRSASRTSSSPMPICPAKARRRLISLSSWTCCLPAFDSKYLNTLYVDKNLKHHGLIQAFSRTKRILNATKPHGQILDFGQPGRARANASTGRQ
jgi:type I site-specific restriction-modification system R (restriction) subunit